MPGDLGEEPCNRHTEIHVRRHLEHPHNTVRVHYITVVVPVGLQIEN